MAENIHFELFLDSDPAMQRRAYSEISDRFGTAPAPMFDEATDRIFTGGHFHILQLEGSWADAWTIAQSLVSIEGVLDVDPVFPANVVAEIDAMIEDLVAQDDGAGREVLPADQRTWFLSGFPKAIEWAIEKCNQGEGHFCGQQTELYVAVLDTGYTEHPEIEAVKKPGVNYVEDGQPALDPLTGIIPFSWSSHGTSTTTMLIGQDTGIPEDAHNGAFKYVNVIPYRISKTVVSISGSNMASALLHASTDTHDCNCALINTSHGVLFGSRRLRESMRAAYHQGVICTAAAGSHIFPFPSILIYPAKFNESIAVAASTPESQPWDKTHRGDAVDLCAPGTEIWRALAKRRDALIEYGYSDSEGTTFSAPLVAAAGALWLAHHGDQIETNYPGSDNAWKRIEAFRQILTSTSRPFPNIEEGAGAGVLNVQALIEAPLPDPAGLTPRSAARPAFSSRAADRVETIYAKELSYLAKLALVETRGDEEKASERVRGRSSERAHRFLEYRRGQLFDQEEIRDNNPLTRLIDAFERDYLY